MSKLQRCNAVEYEFSDELISAAGNYIHEESTKLFNDFVRGEYQQTGIGGLVEDRVKLFVEEIGVDINNILHEDGNTPLIAAVLNDDVEMVNMLLFHKANVMAENTEGLNVFDIINFVENETGEHFSERIKELLFANTENATN